MKNTMKKILGKVLSVLLITVILLTTGTISSISTAATKQYSAGDIINFGMYPQTLIKDSDLIEKLNQCSLSWKSYEYYSSDKSADYMFFSDVKYDGDYYRAVYMEDYRPISSSSQKGENNSYIDNNNYFVNNTYWFKYEPLTWVVLDPDSGLVLSQKIIDTQVFNNSLNNNYENSYIRNWLNNTFYNSAFSSYEKNFIKVTTITNRDLPGSSYSGNDTSDNVFLLSYWDVSGSYNFPYGSSHSSSYKRKALPTDYTKCQGLSIYDNYGGWWLRTASSSWGNASTNEVINVAYDGGIQGLGSLKYTDFVNYLSGIRPAISLDLDNFDKYQLSEKIITGKITGSSNAPKISIDRIWYDYDTDIPGLADAIDKFALNETITCKIRFGKIVACSKSKINSKATLSINTSDNTIEYDSVTKKYSPENISLTIDIANNIVSSSRGSVNTEYIAGYDITFDKIVIDIQDSDMLYFKDGWFGLGKTQNVEKIFDSPVTLKAGKTFYFNDDLTAYVNDNYKWGETELKKDVKVYAYLYNKDEYICADELTVTFKNNEAQNIIKNNAEAEKQSQSAAAILDNTACIIQSDFLSEIFTKEQLKAIQSAIQCKIALCALPESTYKKAGLEDKIIEKLIKKAGVSKDWLGTSYTADISLTVNVDTEKYGQLEIEFNMPTTYYSFGADNPYGGTTFDFTYKIIGGKGKKNVPSDKLTGDILGLGTYANIKNFADSVQKVALSQLESAYNLGYGNDLNKVGDMLFGGTVTKILSKTKSKSYSHLTFTMMTFPAKQVKIHCPVDVYVYNPENTLCASIENNEITMSCEDIDIEVVGDEKYLTVYDGDYSIEIIATAEDKMDISVEEFSYSDEKIRTTSFDNIVLTPGDSFKTTIDTNYLDSEYIIAKNDEENIVADTDSSFIHYVNGVEIIDKEATCTAEGEYHIECAECKKTVLSGSIPAKGHSDSNCDGVCDLCSEDFTKNCTCMCHSNEFIRFIHKLLCFFYRIFGMNEYRVCSCGKAHW